jgi:1,4-alpha-glucan branching enzyme
MSMLAQPDVSIDGASIVVEFRLPHAVVAGHVSVVGEFNDWSTTADPMTAVGDGFIARIWLMPGRSYRFRYLIDGERWENDWDADDYVPNEFGGEDSVIDLSDVRPTSANVPALQSQIAPTGPREQEPS